MNPTDPSQSTPPERTPSDTVAAVVSSETEEHFRPTGTLFILAMFVVALILLWASVYVILISRGVTV